jgi:aminomethyltransferase
MKDLKQTPLHGWHVEYGGKMGPFADYEMPLSYGGAFIREYSAVRKDAGLFDISHMGVIVIDGHDAEKFVQYVTTNDASRLLVGDIQYTLICRDDGGIVDDVTAYKASHTNFFLVVNASNVRKVTAWFLGVNSRKKFDARVTVPNDRAIFALQGPSAEAIISGVIPQFDLPQKRYSFTTVIVRNSPVVVSRTGYTGEDGFEIICPRAIAEILWRELFVAGKKFKLLPCGLVARDMLRTEAGMRLYGHDIDETTNPIEAELRRYVSLEKADFIGRAAIEKAVMLQDRGGGRYFHGLSMEANCFPKHGCRIFVGAEVSIPDEFGVVTSATFSPLLKKRVLLGYLREKRMPGDTVWVKIGEEYRPAIVAALPFYSRKKKT